MITLISGQWREVNKGRRVRKFRSFPLSPFENIQFDQHAVAQSSSSRSYYTNKRLCWRGYVILTSLVHIPKRFLPLPPDGVGDVSKQSDGDVEWGWMSIKMDKGEKCKAAPCLPPHSLEWNHPLPSFHPFHLAPFLWVPLFQLLQSITPLSDISPSLSLSHCFFDVGLISRGLKNNKKNSTS